MFSWDNCNKLEAAIQMMNWVYSSYSSPLSPSGFLFQGRGTCPNAGFMATSINSQCRPGLVEFLMNCCLLFDFSCFAFLAANNDIMFSFHEGRHHQWYIIHGFIYDPSFVVPTVLETSNDLCLNGGFVSKPDSICLVFQCTQFRADICLSFPEMVATVAEIGYIIYY